MGCGTVSKQEIENTKITLSINNYPQFYEAISKGSKLVVLDDDVIDISSFIEKHPGGKLTLEKCIGILCCYTKMYKKGMEIGRFVYGGFNMEGFKVNVHSEFAMKKLITLRVGKIINEITHMIFKPVVTPPTEKPQECTWKLVSKKMVSSVHAVFRFSCDQYKCAYFVNNAHFVN